MFDYKITENMKKETDKLDSLVKLLLMVQPGDSEFFVIEKHIFDIIDSIEEELQGLIYDGKVGR